MSSTHPTAACRTQIGRLAFPTIASCNARNSRVWSIARTERFVGTWPFVPTRSPQFSRSALSSVCAAFKVMPSFSRAMTYRGWADRRRPFRINRAGCQLVCQPTDATDWTTTKCSTRSDPTSATIPQLSASSYATPALLAASVFPELRQDIAFGVGEDVGFLTSLALLSDTLTVPRVFLVWPQRRLPLPDPGSCRSSKRIIIEPLETLTKDRLCHTAMNNIPNHRRCLHIRFLFANHNRRQNPRVKTKESNTAVGGLPNNHQNTPPRRTTTRTLQDHGAHQGRSTTSAIRRLGVAIFSTFRTIAYCVELRPAWPSKRIGRAVHDSERIT
jgi:hypothetical protein